jgi:hypothetical protein
MTYEENLNICLLYFIINKIWAISISQVLNQLFRQFKDDQRTGWVAQVVEHLPSSQSLGPEFKLRPTKIKKQNKQINKDKWCWDLFISNGKTWIFLHALKSKIKILLLCTIKTCGEWHMRTANIH